MKRASYRDAVDFIAFNDNAGDEDLPEAIEGYASTVLVASIFDVPVIKVATDVYKYRIKRGITQPVE